MVSVMARIAAGTTAGGASELEGISAGTSAAFTISAFLGVVTVVIALFIRRNPADAGEQPVEAAPTESEEQAPAR
jgi:DHA2 family lincomycin resistance protein-like MFS transporter